nr:ABC transporter substrate-binding protein [Alphaproteobacteria bacterium]
GAEEFAKKETVALMGVRSLIEGQLHSIGVKVPLVEPPMPGIVRNNWVVAMAVHENSRDLGYAAGDVITKLQASGEMKKIFAKYGISYIPPGG